MKQLLNCKSNSARHQDQEANTRVQTPDEGVDVAPKERKEQRRQEQSRKVHVRYSDQPNKLQGPKAGEDAHTEKAGGNKSNVQEPAKK